MSEPEFMTRVKAVPVVQADESEQTSKKRKNSQNIMDGDTEECSNDARKYFTDDEWNELSRYEKVRIQNSYEIYIDMTSSGFTMTKPEFMSRVKSVPVVQADVPQQTSRKRKISENNDEQLKITRSRTKTNTNGDISPTVRYPRRDLPIKNYKEEELVPDDNYVYCDVCMNEYVNTCSAHVTVHILDHPVPSSRNNPNRARETAPSGWLCVSRSKIENGGEGVWALRDIKLGTRFGPYEGTSEKEEADSYYTWQIKRDGRVIEYIDGKDSSKANWMRYVNCARNKSEQNLMAFQYRGKIYYRAVVDIRPGTELLVFYGPKFARELGIDVKNYSSTSEIALHDNIFECQTCQLGFSNPIYLEKHVSRCGNRKKLKRKQIKDNGVVVNNDNDECFKCHLCDMIYTIKYLYDRHLMVKHCIYDQNIHLNNNKDNAGPSNTDLSSTSNDSGYNEENKNQDATKHRRYKCNQCGKAFIMSNHLETHSRVHTGERPYKCQVCHKTFTLAQNLNRHKVIHTGEKPHQCDVCHKTFNDKSSLMRHKHTHNNVRAYKCSVCDYTFTRACHLSRHKRTHTGERPYHCHMCDYKFTQACNLKRHIRRHHNTQ